MKSTLTGLLFGVLAFVVQPGWGQMVYDLELRENLNKIDIPFEYQNNFIVVKVLFNNIFPLKFIFDTGAEHSILTKREITDLLQVDYQKRFTLFGADLSTELYAYLARGISLQLGDLKATNRSILVLDEDYLRFEEFAGVNIQGVLGADFFRRFVVRIDYQHQMISLYDPRTFDPPRGKYFRYPMEVHRGKPYIWVDTHLTRDTVVRTKLLMDTGASLALLLYTATDPDLRLPDRYITSNIAMGLGGFLQGYIGRVRNVQIQQSIFPEVITNFQEVPLSADTNFTNNRNGIIGNQLLRNFTIIIDYIRGDLYLLPVVKKIKPAVYDRSGLVLSAYGASLSRYTVVDVVAGSPAAGAGIRKGDELKSINGLPAGLFSLEDITKKLRKKVGKRVRLVIERDNVKLKKEFELRNIL
ncbi:MAG: aspartyl protease family protein [Lewinellaceae bacterium]|nr:aspartyl protease family protein [Lewinellaceae bacterium]